MSTSRIKGMTVDIGGDTSSFQAAMKNLEGSIYKCQQSLKDINKALKLDPSSTNLLTEKQKLLASRISEVKDKLNVLKTSYNDVNKAIESGKKLKESEIEHFENLKREIPITEAELKSLENEYKNFGSVAAQQIAVVGQKMQDIGSSVESFGKKVAGLSALSAGLLTAGIKYNAQLEKYETALTTLTGSADKAHDVMAQIQKDAKKTPFDVAGLTQANQLLISTGLDAEDAREVIMALGNAVSATGGGNDELSRMAINLQQIKNVGKASALDIKQFAYAGIDVYGMLADYLGITKEEAAKTTVTWEVMSGALINASKEGGKYFGAMEKQSTTLNGEISNLKNSFNQFTGAISEKFIPKIKQILDYLNDLMAKFDKLDPKTQDLISNILLFTAVLSPALIILGKFISGIGGILKLAPLIVSWFTSLKASVVGLVEVFQLVAGGAGTLHEAFVAVFGSVATTIAGIATIIGGVVIAITNFFSMLKNGFNWIKEAFMVIGIAIAAVGAIILGVPVAIAAAVAAVVAVVATLVVIIKEHWESVKAFFSEALNMIGTFFTVTIPSWINILVNEILPRLPYYIGYAIGWILGKIIEFITNVWNTIIVKIPKIIAKIVQFVSELPGKLWTWFLVVLDKVKEWLSNWLQTMKEKIPQIISAIVDKFMELPGKMLEIGGNIVQGLWNGIQNAKDWLIGKIKEFASGILDGMKNALGIHSPSTVFRDQVGKYIAEGIGVGFDKNIGSVVNDMQKKIGIETSKLSANVDLVANADSLNRVSPTTNNISIVVNAQTLNEESLEQAFVYINRRFGMAY